MAPVTTGYDFEGRTLLDRDGDKIGKVDELYSDVEGGQPEWALVNTGLFGMKKTFVPLRGAEPAGEDVRVPVDKAQVKDAPRIDADGELSEQEEQRLFEHYGVPFTTEGSTTARGVPGEERAGRFERRPEGRDVSGPTTDDAMTRSEEELHVGTERREAGRARLRKYVVTEHEQRTVPVRHEEARIEREPITGANVDQALDGPEISGEEHEVVLHEERPVVEKETRPRERVRMTAEEHRGEETVSEDVRKERIEAEGDERRHDR